MFWPFCNRKRELETPEQELPQYKIFKRVKTGPDGVILSEDYVIHSLHWESVYRARLRRFGYESRYIFYDVAKTYEQALEKKARLDYIDNTKIILEEVKGDNRKS